MAKPPPRLYLDVPLGINQQVELSADHAGYLGKVLRLKEGADLLVFNGNAGEWRASIEGLDRKGGLAVCKEQTREPPSDPEITLIFAPVKKGPTEFMIQKATELGIKNFQPVLTARTLETKTSRRWQAIAIEAAEQCERLSVPTFSSLVPLDEALASRPDFHFMFADEAGDQHEARWGGDVGRAPSAMDVMKNQKHSAPWAIIVGPAGGFTPEERTKLRAWPQCHPVSLGPRILKAETAAIVALTLWQAMLGDFS